MGIFSGLFPGRKQVENPLGWDMHNHLLFGIDDGSKTIENSVEMARKFVEMGYSRVYATPHVMNDYYPNNRSIISEKAEALKIALQAAGIPLDIHFAAEYYVDEVFFEQVRNQEDLLTLHDRHILIETSFMNRPMFFNQLVFELKTQGYQPVFAHPERYVYLHSDYAQIEQLIQQGLKLQINLLSLIGYYSPMVKKLSHWMVKNGHYHFLGTDAHSLDHLKRLPEVYKSRIFSQIDFTKIENAR